MEGKTNFSRAYMLSGTVIVECLENWCNLEQFDGLTWLTLTSIILRQIYATAFNLLDLNS